MGRVRSDREQRRRGAGRRRRSGERETVAQATLATDYFDLRAEDSLEQLLRETVAAYQRALDIVQNQYPRRNDGVVRRVTAQLVGVGKAQLVGVGVQRQQYEHAIAMLTATRRPN